MESWGNGGFLSLWEPWGDAHPAPQYVEKETEAFSLVAPSVWGAHPGGSCPEQWTQNSRPCSPLTALEVAPDEADPGDLRDPPA